MQAFRLLCLQLYFKNDFIISQTQSASYLFRLIKWAAALPLITLSLQTPHFWTLSVRSINAHLNWFTEDILIIKFLHYIKLHTPVGKFNQGSFYLNEVRRINLSENAANSKVKIWMHRNWDDEILNIGQR